MLVVCLTLALSGCTFGGLGLGYLVTPSQKPSRLHRPYATTAAEFEQRFEVRPGVEISVVLRSGQRYSGTYLGFRPLADSAAAAQLRLDTESRGYTKSPHGVLKATGKILLIKSSEILRIQYAPASKAVTYAMGAVGLLLDVLMLVELRSFRSPL